MKRFLFMALFCMSAVLLFAQPVDVESLRPQINQYLSLAAADGIEKYGFRRSDDLSKIQLGELIQTVEMEDGFYDDENESDSYCMQDVEEYRIPLMTDDTIRAFAIVVPQNGQWKVVDFGASGFAQRVDGCYRSCGVRKGHKVKLLRDYNSFTDYIGLSEDDYVVVESMETYKSKADKSNGHKPQHYSKNEVKHELHKQHKAVHSQGNSNNRNNNKKNNGHGKN